MRRSFLLLLFSIMAAVGTSQSLKTDFYDGEFFLAEEDYEEALYAFGQVYKTNNQDNAYINYRMGECLLQIPGRKTEAIPYLETAVKNISTGVKEGKLTEEHSPPEALLYLANAYRINMEIEKALVNYNEYANYINSKDLVLRGYVDQQIVSCGNALVGFNNPISYKVGNLGQLNQTHPSMYNIMVSDDLQTMAFMGKNPFYNGVYFSKKVDGVWSKPLNITPSIVSDGNMDVVGLSADGKTMLLVVTDEFDSNIYTSVFENNRWNPAVSIGKPINSKYFESHASFSPDGKSIYFTSNRKESLGGMDIFRSDLQADGTWGDPLNLGPGINTELNEETPFMSPDGKRLYFSSQGHLTIGGFDVFYAEMNEDGSWSGVPVNLGYPLNTLDDDFAISPTGMKREGTSYLFGKEHIEGYDILMFEMIGRDDTPVPVALEVGEEVEEPVVEEPVAEEIKEPADEEVREPVKETVPVVVQPPEKYLIRPVFFDFDSYTLSREAINKLDELTELLKKFPGLKLEITGHTDAIGTFEYNQQLSLERATAVSKYLILNGITNDRLKTTGMSEREHVARNRTRDDRDAPQGRALNRRAQFRVTLTDDVVIEIEKIKVPDELKPDPQESNVIKPVFFEFDSYALNDQDKGALDDLTALLLKYPSTKLEIKGHTDAIGNPEYNRMLSLKRAEAVSSYLVLNGVSKERLNINAFGESNHVARNRTAEDKDAPEGRALNRRVEFSVLQTGEPILQVESITVPDHLKPNESEPLTEN